MDNLTNIRLFIYTVEEYKRFADYFALKNTHELTDAFSEDEYIAIQTKLIILRKYGNKNEVVYIKKIINKAISLFEDKSEQLNMLIIQYNDIEKNQLQSILADGTELTLYETIEDVMYGLYLHADESRVKRLISNAPSLYFSVTRKYVELLEKLVLDTYNLLTLCVNDKYKILQYEKAPVIYLGDTEQKIKHISNSPFWSNLYGIDALYSNVQEIINDNNEEDNLIILLCTKFMNEVIKEQYSVDYLEKLVFPPTRCDWGDFSKLHNMCNEIPDLGWSTNVRYNDNHDMAYVSLFRNVKGAFIIDQPHVIQDICIITLVYENDFFGWRIFQIGQRAEKYKI